MNLFVSRPLQFGRSFIRTEQVDVKKEISEMANRYGWVPKWMSRGLPRVLRWMGFYIVEQNEQKERCFEEVSIDLAAVQQYFHEMRHECMSRGYRPAAYVIGRDVAEALRISLINDYAFTMNMGDLMRGTRIHPLDRTNFAGVKIIVVPWSTGATIIPEEDR